MTGELTPSTTIGKRIATAEKHGQALAWAPRGPLSWPIWAHPKTAARSTEGYQRSWFVRGEWGSVPHGVETACTRQDYGSLRWLDLDVLMAISYASLLQRVQAPEIPLADLMRWMGYTDLTSAPYATLKESLTRLRYTEVVHWIGQTRPPDEQLDSIRFLEESQIRRAKTGHRHTVRCTLSSAWARYLADDQIDLVDLDAYASLTRSHRGRGHARVTYCLLSTYARHGRFTIPLVDLDWILTPRKPGGRGRRYRSLEHRNNPVLHSIDLLQKRGLIRLIEADGEQITGDILRSGFPRLIAQGIQERIPGTEAMPRLSQMLAEANRQKETVTSTRALARASEAFDLHEQLDAARRLIKGLGRPAVQDALQQGWDQRSLAWLSVWTAWSQEHGYDGADLALPGARWRQRLKTTAPTDWTFDAVATMIAHTGHYQDPGRSLREWMRDKGLTEAR